MVAVLWIVGGLAALYLLIGLVFFELTFRRFRSQSNPMKNITNATDRLLAPYRDLIDEGTEWLVTHPAEDVEITSRDGLRLRGRLYENPDTRAVLVACHGYRSNGMRDFASACRYYGEHGMSILLIDERACGRSEGKYITFGVLECDDARDWCAFAEKRFPGVPLVLAGISMGGAAVLMTADELPDSVAAILADCGFSSAWDELRWAARRYIGRAAEIFVPCVGLWAWALADFGLRDRDARTALAKTDKPVFFVHGEADGLVPCSCSIENRAACAGPSELLTVPGADHGMSYLVDHDGYCAAVDAFLKKYVLPDDQRTEPQHREPYSNPKRLSFVRRT